jgi:hypothetical protein
VNFQGKVVRQQLGTGSKSEHEAVVLMTEDGPIKLRRADGNPFRDSVLEKLVGREIVCDGELHQGQLLITQWNLLSKS